MLRQKNKTVEQGHFLHELGSSPTVSSRWPREAPATAYDGARVMRRTSKRVAQRALGKGVGRGTRGRAGTPPSSPARRQCGWPWWSSLSGDAAASVRARVTVVFTRISNTARSAS